MKNFELSYDNFEIVLSGNGQTEFCFSISEAVKTIARWKYQTVHVEVRCFGDNDILLPFPPMKFWLQKDCPTVVELGLRNKMSAYANQIRQSMAMSDALIEIAEKGTFPVNDPDAMTNISLLIKSLYEKLI